MWVIERMHKEPVRLEATSRAVACERIASGLVSHGVDLRALAVAADHVHGLGGFPGGARKIIGDAKRASSHAMRVWIPGAVWGRRCGLKHVVDREHYIATLRYIVAHTGEGASVWTRARGS